jgi:hypothetical protein
MAFSRGEPDDGNAAKTFHTYCWSGFEPSISVSAPSHEEGDSPSWQGEPGSVVE